MLEYLERVSLLLLNFEYFRNNSLNACYTSERRRWLEGREERRQSVWKCKTGMEGVRRAARN